MLGRKGCYHKWRYFNKWCQECGEFGHGVIVSQCFLCGAMWDSEFGFWSIDEVLNIFFNDYYMG